MSILETLDSLIDWLGSGSPKIAEIRNRLSAIREQVEAIEAANTKFRNDYLYLKNKSEDRIAFLEEENSKLIEKNARLIADKPIHTAVDVAARNDFRGFLGRWLTANQRVRANDARRTYTLYVEFVAHLGGYAAKHAKDFEDREKFNALCQSLLHLTEKDITNDKGDCRLIVAEKIKALIDFV